MLTILLSNFFTTQNLKTFVLKFSQPHTQVLVQKIISHSYQINTTIIIPLTTPTPTLSSPLKLNCTLKIYFKTLLGQQPTFQITKQRPQTNSKLEREWLEPENQLEVHPMDVRQEGFEYQYNYQKGAKETMFQKQLTPSDVGKLNRLVIPKQYAEKHFPPTGKFINTGENGISLSLNTGEKGILLTFEDEIGKIWRFRYSYWNSSQSYVLTKGWSRFVKEKQLDAGDTVVFARQFVCGGCQLFIGWKRRNATIEGEGCAQNTGRSVQDQLQGGKSKILRLFGVDMECQPDHGFEPPARDGSSTSSQGGCGLLHRPTYMDTDFPRDDIQD